MGLVDNALAGDIRALSRLATHVENDDPLAQAALERLYPLSGHARTVGITGPPGVGKSTLINELVTAWRAAGQRVAIIAVDPSSPLSSGAMLGDRIRMLQHQGDPDVFIRSTASRGRTGGLAASTSGLIHLFDAVGYDIVLVETVGVGQEEIDIVHYVDSVILVLSPALGDGIQALKAGVLEIADVYVVAKSDLPGAQATAREIRSLLTLAHSDPGWAPPVISVSVKDSSRIDDLAGAIDRHAAWLRESGSLEHRRRSAAKSEISRRLTRLIDRRLYGGPEDSVTDQLVEEVADRRQSPQSAALELLQNWSARR